MEPSKNGCKATWAKGHKWVYDPYDAEYFCVNCGDIVKKDA